MSFTLIGKHEKDSRANRDGYVSAMLEMMEKDPTVMHVDCDLENCINTGKLAKAFPDRVHQRRYRGSKRDGRCRRPVRDRQDRVYALFRLLRFPPCV